MAGNGSLELQIVRSGPGIESRRQSLHQLVIGWDCLGYYAKSTTVGGESQAQARARPGQRTGGESASASTSEEQ